MTCLASRSGQRCGRLDSALVSGNVLVLELALEHVGDGLEAGVRVVREAALLVEVEILQQDKGVVQGVCLL